MKNLCSFHVLFYYDFGDTALFYSYTRNDNVWHLVLGPVRRSGARGRQFSVAHVLRMNEIQVNLEPYFILHTCGTCTTHAILLHLVSLVVFRKVVRWTDLDFNFIHFYADISVKIHLMLTWF
jgi:hypothetical protein